MGKAARRERNKTTRFLSRLATENPERFNSEWDFRIGSWLVEIRTGFRRGFIDDRPVFNILDKALDLLIDCGDAAMKLQFKRTFDILSTECIRVTAGQVSVGHYGNVLYKLNQKYGFLDYDLRNIKLNGKERSRDGQLRTLSPR